MNSVVAFLARLRSWFRGSSRTSRADENAVGKVVPAANADSNEALSCLRRLLLMHWELVRKQEGKVWDIVIPLYCAVQDSLRSLALLSSKGCVRDSYGISRCILETALNASYVLVAGSETADRAYRHYMQKSLREIERDGDFMRKFLDSEVPTPDWRSSDMFARLLDEFSDSSGREKTWAGISYDGRLRLIGQQLGSREEGMLRIAMHSIYRPASEILHGTFYGAMRAAGQANVPQRFQEHDDYIDWLSEQLSLLLVMSSSAAAVMLAAIGRAADRSQMGGEAIEAVLKGAKSLSSEPDLVS